MVILLATFSCRFSYLTYLKPVVCPRSPLHSTMLHVEWKLFNVDVTYGHVNSVTEPCDLTGVLHYHVSVNNRRTIIRICTKINLKEWQLSTKIYTILIFHFYLMKYPTLHLIKCIISSLIKNTEHKQDV